ncbi:MAG: transposase, partial [Blastocatellia bacterium]|nr:transposase [Blastocatellia bacterium]
MKIKSTRHTVYQIAYHLVWVTKYRRAVLDETVQARLKTLLPE